MKKIIFSFILVLAVAFAASVQVFAGGTSHGAEIVGRETRSEMGHVLDYMYAGGKLERENYHTYSRDWEAATDHTYYALEPEDGTQHIKQGTLYLETGLGSEEKSLQEIFNQYGIYIKLLVTTDRANYIDVTHELSNGYYTGDKAIVGYAIQVKMTKNVIIDPRMYIITTHDIVVEYAQLTPEQLAGKVALSQWLDSKYENREPTGNYQNIFVINPTISGTVKYQRLQGSDAMPDWDQADAIENTEVELVDADNTVLATAKTDAAGNFAFSNAHPDAISFHVDHSLKPLSIRVKGQTMKVWHVAGEELKEDTNTVSVGSLVDISKHQSVFETAFSRTSWQPGYTEKHPDGAKAVDNKFILTDVKQQGTGTVTVHHVDEQGTALVEPQVLTGTVGEQYQTSPQTIPGYTFKMMAENSGPASGTYYEAALQVVYVYAVIEGEQPIDPSVRPVTPESPLPTTGNENYGMLAGGILLIVGWTILVIQRREE